MERFDFSAIDEYLRLFMSAVHQAAGPIGDIAGDILRGLIWVCIAFAAVGIAVGGAGDSQVHRAVRWVIGLWIVGVIGSNWMTILTSLMGGMLGIGASVGGMSAEDFLTPSAIMRMGYKILDVIWLHHEQLCIGISSCIVNMQSVIAYEVAWYLTFFSFLYVVLQVIVAQVTFMYHGIATLLMLGMAAIPQLSWMTERGIGGVIAHGMNLFVLSMLTGVSLVIFKTFDLQADLTVNHAMMAMILSLIMAITVYHARGIAEGILNGGPSLHGGSVGAAMAAGIMALAGGARLATAGGQGVMKASAAGNAALWGSGGGGGATAARAAASSIDTFSGGAGGGGAPAVGGAAAPGAFARIGQGAQSAINTIRTNGVAGTAAIGIRSATRAAQAGAQHQARTGRP